MRIANILTKVEILKIYRNIHPYYYYKLPADLSPFDYLQIKLYTTIYKSNKTKQPSPIYYKMGGHAKFFRVQAS